MFAFLTYDSTHCLLGKHFIKKSAHPAKKGPSFYFPDFFDRDPSPWWHFQETELLTYQQLIDAFPPTPHQVKWLPLLSSSYEKTFQQVKDALSSKKLKKVVPYVIQEGFGQLSLPTLLTSCCLQKGYLYGFWSEGDEMVGVTPELLVASDNLKEWQTMALAGTLQPHQEMNATLLEEHQWVVQDLKERLFFASNLQVGPMAQLSFLHLRHLLTPLSFTSTHLPQDIVHALHPTAALGTYPLSWPWLESFDKQFPRGRFGAPVGFLWPERQQFRAYVAIRNLQKKGDKLYLMAGGGIVANSQFEHEWQEIVAKLAAIRTLFSC